MNPYICVTYAHHDREDTDLFCRGLARYGFRYVCINELGDPIRQKEDLRGASLLIAITSSAAAAAEGVASDIRFDLERGMRVLCVSLEDNELDHRYCTGMTGGAVLIPAPTDDTPDHHALSLFVHRLFVRHLARFGDCFMEERCADNTYGQLIRCAHYAHAGDGEACYELGRAYELGIGVPALVKEGAHWVGLAAAQDVPDALIRMGQFRLTGTGVDRDLYEAFRLFSRAAELDDVRGIYHVGLCYLEGLGVIKDASYAVECLERAASRDYTPALFRLAMLYKSGVGVSVSRRQALRYLYATRRAVPASEEGDVVLCPLLSDQETEGRYRCITLRHLRHTRLTEYPVSAAGKGTHRRGGLPAADRRFARNRVTFEDLPEDRWEISVAERYTTDGREIARTTAQNIEQIYGAENDWNTADTANAAYELGYILAEGSAEEGLYPHPTRALTWYRYAARLGHVEALYALGEAYRRGYGTPAKAERAAELFRLAADNGSMRAQFAYGVCCERGLGTEVNAKEAVRYYEYAAEAGYAPAQNNLGGCFEHGFGVAQNILTAVEWYSAAATAGQPDAQCRMGICYEWGRGVAKDAEKAVRFYQLAADQGHTYAAYRLGLCYDRGLLSEGDGATVLLTEAHSAGTKEAEDAFPEVSEEKEKQREETDVASRHARAASLYRTAAAGGVPEAAYALYLCHRMERGVSRDEGEEMHFLRRAAEGGSLQAAFELGLCCMEGRGIPKDRSMAVSCFEEAVRLWRSRSENQRALLRELELECIPPDALTLKQAAGGALYMLGYCTLYGLGETAESGEADVFSAPSAERVSRAAALFHEAAEIDHVGAVIMLGDLYAYGLLQPKTATAEDESLGYYLEAVRVNGLQAGPVHHGGLGGHTRGSAGRDRTDGSVDMLMSLASRALRVAETEGDAGTAELARVNAWKSYSECAGRGSADALVGMAACLYHGLGAPENPVASVRLLRRAESLDGGRISASLWLGDALRSTWTGHSDPSAADEAYLRGLSCSPVEWEGSPYLLGLRCKERRQADEKARAEILYRVATLRAMYFADPKDRRQAFSYLAEAVLLGHEAALDDLSRMFAYEINRPRGVTLKASRGDRRGDRRGSRRGDRRDLKSKLRRRMREEHAETTRNSRGLRVHHAWLADYYTALWPEPVPFTYDMRSTAKAEDAPAYVTAPVTDAMRVNALLYVGECYFEGYGLQADAKTAVACYRKALELARASGVTSASVAEAEYSLGWCLLYGVGTPVDYPEAIRSLTAAAKTHGGACYTLGVCHEEGRGVVAADDREAIKYYRKALKLGVSTAASKVSVIEKRLQKLSDAL